MLTESFFAGLRAREFSRLDEQGVAYLDYTGSALYGASQVAAQREVLDRSLFGNPHSEHDASRASTAVLEAARRRVLDFLDADPDEYDVCFTANTSAAVKLVGESYAFDLRRGLVLSADNHNSVNGLREYARRAGAWVRTLPLDRALRLSDPMSVLDDTAKQKGPALVAFPAQSNFSGVHHALDLVGEAKRRGFDVLLDAAAFAPSHPLSLRAVSPDFVALSFYKLFGTPTGLGALVARHDALATLQRPWFAGGTVTYASVAADRHHLRAGHEGFEDGTPNFLGAAALDAGFDLLAEVGMAELEQHVEGLAATLREGLERLTHADGSSLVQTYGRGSSAVTFNVFDREARPLPFEEVESRAREARVAVRGGCFCNPGAAEAAFRLEEAGASSASFVDALAHLHHDFSIPRLRADLGPARAVGAVRLSVGLATSAADIGRAIGLVESFAN
jgi:selenocysteine lyase/cysteine desulfurase